MAATIRRPRAAFGAALAASLLLAACSLVRTTEGPADRQEQAARFVHEGRHAEAADVYLQLAQQQPAEHDNYQLLAAEQYIGAGNVGAAKQAFAAVSEEARTKLVTPRALVAAEIAFAEGDATRALRELDQTPVPTAAEQAQNYWWLRGRGAFSTGHPLEGVRALVERERSLADPQALRTNHDEIYARVKASAERGESLKYPPKTDPVVAGWLDLGGVALDMARNPGRVSTALANWRKQYPTHPANDSLLAPTQPQMAAAGELPAQIALLLPLSGRAEAIGVAVRDGFIASYLQQPDAAARPRLLVYDVAATPVATAYAQALSEGASFVVGPLTKEDVAALVPLSNGRTPVLALNFLADGTSLPKDFFQFALLPEDEARMVARRVFADGRHDGVAIVPAGELGTRVEAAFREELKSLGGTLLQTVKYDGNQVDFSDAIKNVMQVRNIKGETPSHRPDASFIFVVGSASATRLIMPQLKFHFSGDVPVYTTSDSYEPDPSANSDIEGMFFPGMPWMIGSDPTALQARDNVRAAWPARTARRDPLYAFGFDAYRLVPILAGHSPQESGPIAGVTGRLRVDERNRVRRELVWAQVHGGIPNAL